jgi:glutathione S-transferase
MGGTSDPEAASHEHRLLLRPHVERDALPAALHNPALAAHTRAELAGLLTLLDGELARAPYLLGAEFSLLDLIVTSVVLYGTFCGASVDAHPHVAAWSTRCAQRPSIARAWGR